MHTCCCPSQEQYKGLESGQEADCPTPVAAAGRVMNKRVMGKLAFLTLRDGRGQIQVCYCRCCCCCFVAAVQARYRCALIVAVVVIVIVAIVLLLLPL